MKQFEFEITFSLNGVVLKEIVKASSFDDAKSALIKMQPNAMVFNCVMVG